jgi:diguanylate cyclase (GGDEF)-like protein
MRTTGKLLVVDACSLLTLALAGAALGGWFAGSRAAAALRPSYLPMAPNTALVLLLLAASLWTLARSARAAQAAGMPAGGVPGPAERAATTAIFAAPAIPAISAVSTISTISTISALAAALAGGLAAARLFEYVSGVELGVDRWLFHFPALPPLPARRQLALAPEGQMGFFTALGCAGLSAALLLLAGAAHRRRAVRAAEVLALGAAVLAAAFALGYAYDAPLIYDGPNIPMALNTALCLVALGAAAARLAGERAGRARLSQAAFRRTGEETAVEVSASGFRRGDERFFAGLFHGPRSRRLVERRLREDRQRFEVLSEISRIAMEDLEYRPMLQRLCDTLARSFNWEFVAVISALPERGKFVCEALATTLPTDIHVGYERELGSGVVGQVAATGVPILLDDVADHPGYVETLSGVRSEACVAIEHKGRRLAVLNLESREVGAFRHQLPFLTKVAEQVAGALASARLYEETRRSAHLALIDGLTGIANRRQFDSVLDREWRRAYRGRTALSLVLLDIDCFKLFNDAYGHPRGDECLRQVAAAFAEVAHRGADLVARYGGEEFALVLPEVDARGALRLAEAARHAVEALAIPHATSTAATVVTASAGVATGYPAAGGTIETLVAEADRGLYLAKRQGRNRVVEAVAAGAGAGRGPVAD